MLLIMKVKGVYERETLLQNNELCANEKFILRKKKKFRLQIFQINKKFFIQVYFRFLGITGDFFPFSTQEFRRKVIFLQYLRNFHDILETKKDDLSILNDKAIRCFLCHGILCLLFNVYWSVLVSDFSEIENAVFFEPEI